MRCPDCNVFVPYDTEVEPEGEAKLEGGHLSGDYTRALNCENCGTELKTGEINFDVAVEIKLPEDATDKQKACEHDWNEEEAEITASPTTDVQTKDRHGKPIKNPRYMTTLYGVELEGQVTCNKCKVVGTFSASESMAASSFDECV